VDRGDHSNTSGASISKTMNNEFSEDMIDVSYVVPPQQASSIFDLIRFTVQQAQPHTTEL
jgi:hypothetical protein